jgi:hypothetical protein
VTIGPNRVLKVDRHNSQLNHLMTAIILAEDDKIVERRNLGVWGFIWRDTESVATYRIPVISVCVEVVKIENIVANYQF